MKLKAFDNLIQIRFETLIKNIKSNSNSFYDSYLDLLEGTIKFILDSNNINYNKSSTCGNIIKEKEVSAFLLDKLCLDEHTFDKLPDYIKKCNDHKHKKEKQLNIDSITNYLRIYFNLINYYYNYINEENIVYDENYFISIFKETEILNNKYKEEITVLKRDIISLYKKQKITDEEFDKYEKILSIKEIEKFNLEEQNKLLEIKLNILMEFQDKRTIEQKIEKIEKQNEELLKQIKKIEDKQTENEPKLSNQQLLMFLKSSQKYYIWFGEKFTSYKEIVLYSGIINILLSVLLTIIVTAQYGIYSTYTFLENIYCFFMIAIIIKNNKMKKKMNHFVLAYQSTFKYYLNNQLLYYTNNKEMKVYKIFRILAYASSIISSFLAITEFKTISVLIILLEILYFGSLLVNSIFKQRIHEGYGFFVQYVGKQLKGNDIVSIVYVEFENKYYPYDEFEKKYQIDKID